MTRLLARSPALVLAVVLSGCLGPIRRPLLPQHVNSGSPPPVRPAVYGTRAFVVFQDAWFNESQLGLEGSTWPERARAPRYLTVVATCARAPEAQRVALVDAGTGKRFSAYVFWNQLCPGERAPERIAITVELTDVCIEEQCETIRGSFALARTLPPWPGAQR